MAADINSYRLTLRKIESLAEASFHDALLAVILVTTMLFRVFSRSLDLEKTWYALNDRLCGKQPRKFSEGSFFQLFPDEFLHVNFADLHNKNRCPVSSQWFNKLNYGVHLRTNIIENKIQFEVQKLVYPCRNLVI